MSNPLLEKIKAEAEKERETLCKPRYADGTPMNFCQPFMTEDRAWTLLSRTSNSPSETVRNMHQALLSAYRTQERMLAEMRDMAQEIQKLRNEKLIYVDNPGPYA